MQEGALGRRNFGVGAGGRKQLCLQLRAVSEECGEQVGGLTVFCNILMDSLLAMTLDKHKLQKMHVPMWRLVRDLKLLEVLSSE